MEQTVNVSVIVPVYNVEKYLRQCLDSIISQTLTNIEIICVDDGSDDGSIELIREYQAHDPRITLLLQSHQYAGTARNLGMEHARGKYLVFWDSDDYFRPNALELMYHKCEEDQADICMCAGRVYYDQQGFEAPAPRHLRKAEIPEQIPFNRISAPDHIMSITVEAAWNKMFRRDFVAQTGLQFKCTRNANDVFFVVCSLCLAERVTLVNKPLVCYRKDKASGLVSSVSKGLLNALNTWVETAEYLRERDAIPERSFANRALESVIYLLNGTGDWDAFREGYLFLQNGNLEKLCIRPVEDDSYYYIGFHAEAVRRLYSNPPEVFCKWLETIYFHKEDAAVGHRRRDNEVNQKKIKKNERLAKDYAAEAEAATALVKKQQSEIELLRRQKQEEIDLLRRQKQEELDRLRRQKQEEIDRLRRQNRKTQAKLDQVKKQKQRIQHSLSFRIGRGITFVPRKIRGLLRKLKNALVK